MKKLVAKIKTVPQRSMLILSLIFIFALGKFWSMSTALGLCHAVLFPWAVCQAYSMYQKGEFVKDSTWKWVCASLILYVASSLITMTVDVTWSTKIGTIFTASVFMLYAPATMSAKEMRSNLFAIGCMMVCLYLPFVLVALLSVFTGQTLHIPGFDGYIGIYKTGGVTNRIQIFSNTNITARYLAYNILFSIYAIHVKKNKAPRAFFAVCILINFLGLVHTQSRTSIIAFCVALGVYTFRMVYLGLKRFRWRIFAGAAACLVVFFLVLNGINLINKIDISIAKMNYAQRTAAKQTTEKKETENSPSQVEQITTRVENMTSRTEKHGQFDVYGTGRGDIWPPAIEYMLDHPSKLVFGLGQGDIITEIGAEHPQILRYNHLHNSFLACAVRCGIPFLICILGFLCTLVVPSWRMLVRTEDEDSKGMFMVPVFIVMLLLMSVPEELLFIREYYGNMLFYLLCGFTLRFKHLEKRKTNEN